MRDKTEKRFIDTIAIEDRQMVDPFDHADRILRTALQNGGLVTNPELDRDTILRKLDVMGVMNYRVLAPQDYNKLLKFKVYYDTDGVQFARMTPYVRRSITALQPVVIADDLDYSYKWEDRSDLEAYAEGLRADVEPLLVRSDGSLTDTTFTNIILRFGNELLTPSTPLLAGVQRGRLLRKHQIAEADLMLDDIEMCDEIYLINSMLPLERAICLDPEQVLPLIRRR